MTTEPIYLATQTLIVFELLVQLIKAHPGVSKFARGVILIALIVASATVIVTLSIDLHHITHKLRDLQTMFLWKQASTTLLGMLVIFTLALLPAAHSARNLQLHGWLLVLLFLSTAVGFLTINIQHSSPLVGTLVLAFQCACYIGWILGFTRTPGRPAVRSAAEIDATRRRMRELTYVAKWLLAKDE